MIIGYEQSTVARGGIGSLLLAGREGHDWVYVGSVSTGSNTKDAEYLRATLEKLKTTRPAAVLKGKNLVFAQPTLWRSALRSAPGLKQDDPREGAALLFLFLAMLRAFPLPAVRGSASASTLGQPCNRFRWRTEPARPAPRDHLALCRAGPYSSRSGATAHLLHLQTIR